MLIGVNSWGEIFVAYNGTIHTVSKQAMIFFIGTPSFLLEIKIATHVIASDGLAH